MNENKTIIKELDCTLSDEWTNGAICKSTNLFEWF